MSWLRKHRNKAKEHLRELNRIRCQRYYQRHKQEIKESKKYGSLWAYRKHKENLVKSLLETEKKESKKQEFVPQFL